MKQFAMTVNLKNDPKVIRTYKWHHDHIWPEVVTSLQAVGIHDLKIWILGRRLFMLLTTADNFDPVVDFPRYLSLDPKCQEWEDLMTTYQEPVPEAPPGEKWALMQEIYTLLPYLK